MEFDQNEEAEIKIEEGLRKLREETTKQINDGVTQATIASQSLTKISETVSKALENLTIVQQSLKAKQDNMMQMINSHKRANLDMIEEQATKKRRITEEATEKLTSLQQKMSESAEKAEDIIKLNVGGQKFETLKTTLLAAPYFNGMLGSEHWKPQPDGSYFIDRNPYYFKIILDYLRTDLLCSQGLTVLQQQFLQCEMDYFQIPVPAPKFQRANSQILADLEGLEKILVSWLPDKQKIGPLLFRASQESELSAERFHEACDGQAPLLIIARTKAGDICGGYAASPFSSTDIVTAVASEKSWIFTLTNQFDVPPTRFYPQKPEVAQASYKKWGPAFGASNTTTNPDLLFFGIVMQTCGRTEFPRAYKDTTGRGQELFSRQDSYFRLSIVEVFKVVTE